MSVAGLTRLPEAPRSAVDVDFYRPRCARTMQRSSSTAPRLPVHDRDDRRAGDLPRRLVDDRGHSRAARSRAHAGGLRRLLHRLDVGPEHEHRLHAVRVGGADPRGQLSGPAAAAAAPDPLRPGVRSRAGRSSWIVLYAADRLRLCVRCSTRLSIRRALEIVVFFFAIWGAYVIRSINTCILGMITFWTTRGARSSRSGSCAELLLLRAPGAADSSCRNGAVLANWFPFKWTFYFPISALVGDCRTASCSRGSGSQLLWIGTVSTCASSGVCGTPLLGGRNDAHACFVSIGALSPSRAR